MPVLAPITATGLPRSVLESHRARDPVEAVLQEARDRVVVLGRGEQDRVRLTDLARAASPRTPGRRASRSSSNGGMSCRPSKISNSVPDGSSVAAARRSSVLCESRRRLPLMPRTRIGLRLCELELDRQLDLVAEREAALGQRRVPLEAVLGAVDLGLEGEADLGVAGDVLVRADVGAAATRRGCVLPLIVSSPSTTASSPSMRIEVDSKRISGYCSVSKKSGDWRCPARFSSLTTIVVGLTDAGRASRCRRRLPRAWRRSRRSGRGRSTTTMCFTAKPAVEWILSVSQLAGGELLVRTAGWWPSSRASLELGVRCVSLAVFRVVDRSPLTP